jgi:hypothetical protein
MAVPTRTMVLPAAMACAMSEDIPMDTVSNFKPSCAIHPATGAARQTVRQRFGIVSRLGNAHQAAQLQFGRAATAWANSLASCGCAAALALPDTFT